MGQARRRDDAVGSEVEIFRSFIQGRNMRYTPEREAVVREVFARHDHFTADDLYLGLRQKNQRISRSSVYRTLPLMIAAGLVDEVFQEDGVSYYEHTYGHEDHCHLRCLVCGRIEEFTEPAMQEMEKRLARRLGYRVTGHRLEVSGVCPRCQKTEDQGQQ